MTFMNPWGFLGLFSLPVILVLHMLRGRSKTMPISSLALWAFLKPEVRGSRLKRIPITWLLFIDLFIALLLSLALAQPRLFVNIPIKGMQHLVIIVDHSLSMQADDVLPNRQSQANLTAVKIITEAGANDIISVIAFNESPVLLGDTRKTNIQNLINQVTSYKATSIGNALQEALVMGIALVDEIPAQFYVISDHSFEQPDLSEFKYPLTWIKVGISDNNQSTKNLTVEWTEENRLQVFASFANYNDQAVRRMATILVDGNPFDSQNLYLPARQEVDLIWELVSKPGFICITLLGDDALAEDDQRCLGLSDQTKKQVIFVCDDCKKDQESLKKNPIFHALSAIPNLDIDVMLPFEYSPLMTSDWTIFQNSIPSEWPDNMITLFLSGDEIIGIPEGLLPISGQKTLIKQEHSLEINSNDEILQNIDLNGLRWGNAIEFSELPTNFEKILFVNNTSLIFKDKSHSYPLYIIISDLVSGNLIQHPAFPLFFINLANLSRTSSLPLEINLGELINLPDKKLFQTLQINTSSELLTFINTNWPEKFIDTMQPGLYQFTFEDKNGNTIVNYVGVNAGEEKESDLSVHPREDLLEEELQGDAHSQNQGVDL
ncbi:MAG: BatA and WFA domain-containing protein, partial [Anaerolineaceae bacterium]|nr:BatA and WFA domain-containing protein [Anaerolineaceae bacterium]